MIQPTVSVIIPAHNRPELLTDAVRSIAQQTYAPIEPIVVDDGSTPPLDLNQLQQAGGATVRIERHLQPTRTAGAKNTGIRAAQGDLITFLDDDDLLAPTYIERAVQILLNHPGRDVLFMGVDWFGKFGPAARSAYEQGMARIMEEAAAEQPEPGVYLFGSDLYAALVRRVPMAFQRTVVRRSVFERVGLYRQGCALQDCDWAIRAARLAKCVLCTEPLYLQRMDGQGVASRPERKEQHAKARIDIIENMLRTAHQRQAVEGEVDMLKNALADAWFDLAYHYSNTGQTRSAVSALCRSQRQHHRFYRWRLLARLGLGFSGQARDGSRARHELRR